MLSCGTEWLDDMDRQIWARTHTHTRTHTHGPSHNAIIQAWLSTLKKTRAPSQREFKQEDTHTHTHTHTHTETSDHGSVTYVVSGHLKSRSCPIINLSGWNLGQKTQRSSNMADRPQAPLLNNENIFFDTIVAFFFFFFKIYELEYMPHPQCQ